MTLTFARYRGLVFPIRIASGSMAPALLGPHQLVNCSECKFSFRCGVDTQAPLGRATCPNCGFSQNELSLSTERLGDRVVINRGVYWFGEPRRGDIIAIIDPTDKTQLAVKRVVGLPTESITIRGGELYINGDLFQKSLDQALLSATLVYDDNFRPPVESNLPTRWQAEKETSGWRTICDTYQWQLRDTESETGDWLTYRHWRCYSSPHPRTEEAAIADHCAYNQGLSRALYEVTDVMLSCTVRCPGAGLVYFIVNDGREPFTFKLSTTSRMLTLLREGATLTQAAIPSSVDFQEIAVVVGVVDQQLQLTINGQTILREDYEPTDLPVQPTARPFAIATDITRATVANLKVFRDIYHLNPHRGNWAWSAPPASTPRDGLFLLGDNSPLSNDSRHWTPTFIPKTDVIGKVMLLSR